MSIYYAVVNFYEALFVSSQFHYPGVNNVSAICIYSLREFAAVSIFFRENIPSFFFPKEADQGGVVAYICKLMVGLSYESVGLTVGHLQLSEEKTKNGQEMPGGDGHVWNCLRLGYGSHFSHSPVRFSPIFILTCELFSQQ